MTWSEAFRVYIGRRFGSEATQAKAAASLKTTPSNVSYWCNGKLPRDAWRERIERWSKGEVPAELHVVRRVG